ncbi:hypothetical protein [Bartonella sp. WD12.1]|uniref:hypothetical protein n=1 Tax=Bartonella sp. WD12.1 TaxID=1933903 RepID=UPI0009C47EE6|nr:hypothetical protein [Bartonella sp. WD12.1]OPB30433.1 hypothetical protein BWD121_014900 [Bartonella sp. WD12.1]
MKNGKKERKNDMLSSSAREVGRQVNAISETPQMRSLTYRIAYMDQEFMIRPELRSQRLGLEFLKPEMVFQECGIQSTVVLFGGARIPEFGQEAWAAKNQQQKNNLQNMSHYYDEAREFARLCSRYSSTTKYREFVIATGEDLG